MNRPTPEPSNQIADTLLARLRCPLSKTTLRAATLAEVGQINAAIAAGGVRDHVGAAVDEAVDGGLISQAAERVYPIRDQIPSLVIEESIVWPMELPANT